MEEADRYRCRYVYLKQSSDPARQATAACEALADIDGILLAAPHDEHSAHIVYSLDDLSFEIVATTCPSRIPGNPPKNGKTPRFRIGTRNNTGTIITRCMR
jgi:hypothetical protein